MGWFSKKQYSILGVSFIGDDERTFFVLGEGEYGSQNVIDIMMQFSNPSVMFISLNFWIPNKG